MITSLQNAWYKQHKWIWCLFPLTLIFFFLSALRRLLFNLGIMKSTGSDIPVIVVGNIGVGGNGKTPLVLALISELQEKGYTPAVLSRGYGGAQAKFPHLLTYNDTAALVGDEPALIMQREQCIVVIDPVRSRGVNYIQQQTDANVVICDDGLQHYAMQRDVEICVLDKRGLGNGYLLPMGPLREGKWRLNSVDAVVRNIGFSTNKSNQALNGPRSDFEMVLLPVCWVNVTTRETLSLSECKTMIAAQYADQDVLALAGIGDPKRFFDTLEVMGIEVTKTKSFMDHYRFTEPDIPVDACVLMTEKDAVKCFNFTRPNAWYLQIDATLPNDFYTRIETGICTKAAALVKKRA